MLSIKKVKFLSILLSLYLLNVTAQEKKPIAPITVDQKTATITLTVTVPPDSYIYHESIKLSVDTPDTIIAGWNISATPINYYDPSFQTTKKAYNQPFELDIRLTRLDNKQNSAPFNVHLAYYTTAQQKIIEKIIPIQFQKKASNFKKTIIDVQSNSDKLSTQKDESAQECIPSACPTQTWSEWVSDLVEATDSLWIRMILVLMLGFLMSLTPCIYPMIPVTIGILQAQGGKSVIYNFFLSLSYSFGIAMTFATLGLVAAFSGQLFGTLLFNPWVVIPLVALLTYLGFSMMGFYDMYVPRLLQTNKTARGGSLTSAFLFGVASGTVASPCLSPGLVLLLSIITTLGNKLLGFVLLFCFGVGLSIPLLLIGLFSGSIAGMPQAGNWMIEIKRLFAFLLFGTCFYFLSNILTLHLLLWLMSLSFLSGGIFYLYIAQTDSTRLWKFIKNIIGVIFIIISVLLATRAYQANLSEYTSDTTGWHTDYSEARQEARLSKKKLLIDVGAPCCSICHAIDTRIFQNTLVKKIVTTMMVPLKIDGSDSSESICTILKTYQVVGFPTILVVDPNDEKIIQQWGAELYNADPISFANELKLIT